VPFGKSKQQPIEARAAEVFTPREKEFPAGGCNPFTMQASTHAQLWLLVSLLLQTRRAGHSTPSKTSTR
jgi:hypothetical protein